MDAPTARAARDDSTFLDVREPFEYVAGHVEGSLHVPMNDVGARIDEIPRDRRVVVVCHLGQRSALVADYLRRQGIDAHNLEGGLEAWAAAGFELVTES